MRVLAATPAGTYGGGGEVEVSAWAGIIGPLVGVVVVLGIVAALGAVVARIGGPGARGGRWGLPTSVAGQATLAVMAIYALGSGAFIGWYFVTSRASGGLGGVLGAAFSVLMLGAELLLLLGVGVAATVMRRRRLSPAIRSLLIAGSLVLIGAVGSAAWTNAVGRGGPAEQVVLEASGQATAEFAPSAIRFVPSDAGEARCTSFDHSTLVSNVTAFDLGRLGTGILRANLNLPPTGAFKVFGEFWIDGGGLPEGSVQPFWNATFRVINLATDGASGQLEVDLDAQEAVSGWPNVLSGSVSWTCSAW